MLDEMSDEELIHAIAHMKTAGTDSQFYEVKTCRKELTRDIGRTISGFANGSGGTILCGLDENANFSPVEGFDAARIQDALANYCGQKMTPPIRAEIQVRVLDGAPIVAAYIPELRPKQKPCYITTSGCYNGSYVRVGDGDRRLSSYEIDRLISEHEQPRYDDVIVPDATIEDLDPTLLAGLLEREKTMHPRNLGELDDETVLCKLHVVKADEKGNLRPTLAGLLALGSYPQEFFPRLVIAFTCYPGLTKTEALPDGRRFVDSFTCVGPIPQMIEDAVAAATRNMRIGSRFEGAFRYDVPDYPPLALREAITNAVMHRDYSPDAQGSAVYLDMYADRLEIINAGGLFGAVTLDDLGSDHVAGSCRNQHLASILESTPRGLSHPSSTSGYVAENRGTGYLVIKQELERIGKPAPLARASLAQFSLTFFKEQLPYEQKLQETVSYPKKMNNSTESIEYAIIQIAEAKESVSMKELMDALKRSRPTVRKRVANLVARGVLVPTQAKNSPQQRYRLSARFATREASSYANF